MSSILVPLESLSAMLVMISNKYVPICNHFHARRVDSGKITIVDRVSFFHALVRESINPAAPNFVTIN